MRQVFAEFVELPEPQLGGFSMMAGRGFGHRRVVYQTGLAKDLRSQTVLARRPPRVGCGLPVALQFVQPRQRSLITNLFYRPPGSWEGRVRRAELALVQGEDGCAGGSLRLAGSRPRLDGFVVTAAAGEPFGETTITALGGGDVSGAAEQASRLTEMVAARPPQHLCGLCLSAQFESDSRRLVPLLALSVECKGPSFITLFRSHLCSADEVAAAHQGSLQPLLWAAAKQKLGQRPDDDPARR